MCTGNEVLSGVGLTVIPGTKVGVVGENGRGKSTLLSALAGRLEPGRGEVRLAGTLYVEQQLDAASGRTVGDVIDAALSPSRDALAELDRTTALLAHGGQDDAYQAALETVEAIQAWDADRRMS